jgi:hypothetical protein
MKLVPWMGVLRTSNKTRAIHELLHGPGIEKVDVLVVNGIKLAVLNHIRLTRLNVDTAAGRQETFGVLKEAEGIPVVRKDVLGVYEIKLNTRIV